MIFENMEKPQMKKKKLYSFLVCPRDEMWPHTGNRSGWEGPLCGSPSLPALGVCEF